MRAMVDDGLSLRAVCDNRNVSHWSAYRAIHADPNTRGAYARAVDAYIHGRVGDLDRIAEQVADVARARLMCDNIKWTASKLSRHTYGDTVRHEISGGIDLRAAIDAGQRRVDARLAGRTIEPDPGAAMRPIGDPQPAPRLQVLDSKGDGVGDAADRQSVSAAPSMLDVLRPDKIPW